jgi:hypothetical protein
MGTALGEMSWPEASRAAAGAALRAIERREPPA